MWSWRSLVSLLTTPLLARLLEYNRIDKHPFKIFATRITIFSLGNRRSINYKQPNALPYLRCCQTNAIGVVHRFEHVFDELLEVRIIFINILSALFQYRIAVCYYGENHGAKISTKCEIRGTGDWGQGTRDRGLVIGCKVQGPGFLKQKECHNQPHEPCSPLLRRGAGGEARNARARY